MENSRAEYLRAYRATRRVPPAARPCETCGTVFTPKRGHARYCSAACRAGQWRSVTHHIVTHNPDGFDVPANRYVSAGRERLELCLGCIMAQNPSPRFGTWKVVYLPNRERHLEGTGHYCDEHRPQVETDIAPAQAWTVQAADGVKRGLRA